MLAHELITDDIPPLKTSDSGLKAIGWMDDFKVMHLPVIDGINYLGLISEYDVMDATDPELDISDITVSLKPIFALESMHVFEVVKLISSFEVSIIPVIDDNNEYLGSITIMHLMKVISEMSIVSDVGGIIILEIGIHDYHLSEIARIVEDNDSKILGTFVTSHTDSTKMQITIKVNTSDIQSMLNGFERFGYNVTATYNFNKDGKDFQDRYNSLMNYLNI